MDKDGCDPRLGPGLTARHSAPSVKRSASSNVTCETCVRTPSLGRPNRRTPDPRESAAANPPFAKSASPSPGPRPATDARAPLWLYQTPPDRVPRQLDPVAHAELLKNVGAVTLNGLDADDECVCDLLRRMGLSDEL